MHSWRVINSAHLPSSLSEKDLVEEPKAEEWDADDTQTVTDVEQDVKTTDVQESPGTLNGAYFPSSPSEEALVEAAE